MTQHHKFLHFLSDVLAQAEEPAEPTEPHCLTKALRCSAEKLPGGTRGTVSSDDEPGSALHTETPDPCGTVELQHEQRLSWSGSAVPQFRKEEASCEREAGCSMSDEGERSAIALVEGHVPAVYAAAFARLQVARPLAVPDRQWQQTINDAGVFLDEWGQRAEHLGWTPDDLFAPPVEAHHRGGLVWRLEGRRVAAVLVKGALVYCSLRQVANGVPVREAQSKTIVWLRGEMAGRHLR